jgi:uncharacterized protein
MRRVCSFALLFVVLTNTGPARGATADMPPLPALNDPSTHKHLPGKFVWADYFTSNVEAARKFYAALFGWEWREVVPDPENRYGVFYQDGEPVAGVAYRAAPDPTQEYGRWIYYISVKDVAAAVHNVEASGGRTLLPPRSYPNRGMFAVVRDPEAAPFGVINSSSGDPPDYQVSRGQWFWFGLFANNANTAAEFYAGLAGYETYVPDPAFDVLDYVLSGGGYARAGVRQLDANTESHPSWVGYVRVDDVVKTTKSVKALGGTTLLAPNPKVVGGDLAILADPLGAPVGIMRWVYEGAAVQGLQP